MFEICNTGDSKWSNDCPEECCFQVVYFEKGEGATVNDYELFIAAYYPSNNSQPAACSTCVNKEALYMQVIREILKGKAADPDHPNFKHKFLTHGGESPGHITMYVYSFAQCKDNNGVVCDHDIQHCCKKRISVDTTGADQYLTNSDITLDPVYYGEDPPCPYSCPAVCYEVPMYSTDPYDCDKPCQNGFWYYKEFKADETANPPIPPIPVPGCPGCTIKKIEYKYKPNNGCTTPYRDFEILGFEFSDPGCADCFDINQMAYLREWLMLNGPFPLPIDDGDCIEVWRITHAKCWYKVGSELKPCSPDNACCINYFKICNDEAPGKNYTITPTGSQTGNVVCVLPCRGLCAVPLRQPSLENEINKGIAEKYGCNSFAAPSPAFTQTDIHFISHFKGSVRLVVFNIEGNIIYGSETSKNGSELIMPVSLSNFTTGTYIYHLYIGEDLACKGNFVVNK